MLLACAAAAAAMEAVSEVCPETPWGPGMRLLIPAADWRAAAVTAIDAADVTEVVWGLGVTEGGIEDGDEIGLSKYGDWAKGFTL